MLLTKDSNTKQNKGNALLIGKEAREAKALNSNVIDSTIGMLFDEDGSFYTFKTVEMASNALSGREKYSYGATSGDKSFHEALYKWVYRQYLEEVRNNCYLGCVATPGGSGAICNAFSNYLDNGEKVLLPSLMWTNYIQVAKEEHLGYETYELFDKEGNFNLESFKNKCLMLKESQNRILAVINDPCQNPTGYSMSYEEWEAVVSIANEISSDNTPFILLYDMAYIDYDKRGFDASRQNIRLFEKLGDNAMAILCFSGSKTLGLYGLRVGAMIGMAKTKENIDDFIRVNDYSARGKWSGTSTLGQNIITKVFNEYSSEFANELEYARKLLIDRANMFINEAKSVGLNHYPYDCGFFVTIPCDDPQKAFNDLKEKGLFIIPLSNAIRLTLSSITLEEVKRAVHIIKETI